MHIRRATLDDCLSLSSLCTDVQRLHAEYHSDIFKMPQSEDFSYLSSIKRLPTQRQLFSSLKAMGNLLDMLYAD